MPSDTPALTDSDKALCLFYTGYSGLSTVAGLTGAWPAAYETSYIITSALQRILPAAIPNVKLILGRLSRIDTILGDDALERLAVERMGDMVLRGTVKGQSETDRLWQERERWVDVLCNTLGVARYQYAVGQGSINVTVNH